MAQRYFKNVNQAINQVDTPVFKALKFNRMSLQSFIVEKTQLNYMSLKYITSIFSSCLNLTHIALEDVISSDNISNEDFHIALIETLAYIVHMKHLISFNISRNHLKDEFISRLTPILQVSKIQSLDLSGNSITDEGLLYLCLYLKEN